MPDHSDVSQPVERHLLFSGWLEMKVRVGWSKRWCEFTETKGTVVTHARFTRHKSRTVAGSEDASTKHVELSTGVTLERNDASESRTFCLGCVEWKADLEFRAANAEEAMAWFYLLERGLAGGSGDKKMDGQVSGSIGVGESEAIVHKDDVAVAESAGRDVGDGRVGEVSEDMFLDLLDLQKEPETSSPEPQVLPEDWMHLM